MAELLLEIGVEEMPAPWLPGLAEQLRTRFAETAGRESLEAAGIQTFWTPRRLVLCASVAGRQPDREETVWGPSLKVARDVAGGWTGAALGFARKNGVAVEALEAAPKDPRKPEELYLRIVRRTTGRETAGVVSALLPSVLRSLSFPKRMSWDAWLDDGRGAFPFGRPIRWLVLLLDGVVVPFAIHGLVGGEKGPVVVETGSTTRGHRFLPPGNGGRPVGVRSFAELKDRLRERFVLVEPAERLARIDQGLERAAGGARFDDHGLREEWRDLVEYPSVITGEVPAEFRSLPVEVLETVLVHHQKYVPLRGRDGRVARFAAVVNGDAASFSEIVRGMERVVVARLRDAAFFLDEDRRRPLAERVNDLGGVTFHKGLGSYRDKADRVVRLVAAMAEQRVLEAPLAAFAQHAARLAKADLTTLMVREFPELQGVMGGLYLEAEGAAEEVATAVRWHYHPLTIEPEAEPAGALSGRDGARRVFAVVSLADKLDTLAGYFGLGLVPSGSSDPFGLRRAAQGAVRVLLDFWRPGPAERRPDLALLTEAAVGGYGSTLSRPTAETVADLGTFLVDRLAYVLGSRGFPRDEVEAVLSDDPAAERPRALSDPLGAHERLRSLHDVRAGSQEDFAALAAAFKRAKNILAKQQTAAEVDPALFDGEAERALHRAVEEASRAGGDDDARLRGLARLRAPVDRFFDDVLVMAEDPRVRENRLALLRDTLSLFYRIADISKLGGSP